MIIQVKKYEKFSFSLRHVIAYGRFLPLHFPNVAHVAATLYGGDAEED